jgi:hypothetical protein
LSRGIIGEFVECRNQRERWRWQRVPRKKFGLAEPSLSASPVIPREKGMNTTSFTLEIHSRQARPSLSEVARARPRRGAGAPARSVSHKSAIFALLFKRGPAGVLGSELYNSPEKFGRSPRNRISELRQEGHLISGAPRGVSDWHYVLIRDNAGAKPPADLPESPQADAASAFNPQTDDWYESQTGKPRPSADVHLPLFAGVS